jgi:hypothetical protein
MPSKLGHQNGNRLAFTLKRLTLSRGIQVACISFVIWLPCVLLLIRLKEDVLEHDGYRAAAQMFASTDALTTRDRLALFRSDLVVGLVVAPLTLIFLNLAFPAGHRPVIVALEATVILILACIQHLCLNRVGMYQSIHSLREAVFWGRANEDVARQYLPFTRTYIKIAGLIIFQWGIAAWAARRMARAPEMPFRPFHYLLPIAIAALVGGALISTWTVRVPSSVLDRSAFLNSMQVFLGLDYEVRVAHLLPGKAVTDYRELAEIPGKPPLSPYHGTARGCDVIWFLLETAPARSLPPADPLDDFPNLRTLSRHSMTASRHHTTFPVTLEAISSMLMSFYPVRNETLERLAPSKTFPGIGTSLSERGYTTAIYFADPIQQITQDWLRAAGMKRIWTSNPRFAERMHTLADRAERDVVALKVLLADVDNWTKAGQRYFAIFDPQIGHGAPWNVDSNVKTSEETYHIRRDMIHLQDEWLGEILSVLKRNGRLEHTIIIVTGDHGVRSVTEDPSFHFHVLDETTFHVPFYLYAPTSFGKHLVVDWVTSHIDIAPSILDLLGIDDHRGLEQGTFLWNPQLESRITFLWGAKYMGVDGFYRGGQFFSVNVLNGEVMHSHRLRNVEFQPLTDKDEDKDSVAVRLSKMRALIQEWPQLDSDLR